MNDTRRVELAGETYEFTPPKLGPVVMAMLDAQASGEQLTAARAALDWIGTGLSDTDGERVLSRLRDYDDPLDLFDLVDFAKDALADAVDRPTGPPSA